MNKEEAIRFAGLMEDYLNIPSFVCEMIQQQLEQNKYKEVVEYVVQRRNEIESKEDYISYQQAINMWIKKLGEKDKEIERLNNKIKQLQDKLDKIYIIISKMIDKKITPLCSRYNLVSYIFNNYEEIIKIIDEE